jgi:hypothetical protein
MAIRKFLTSVADVYGYDSSDNLVFVGKTLLDSSIEVSLGSAPVRGGKGNQLQYIYYHTGEMKFTLTDTQWNLGMLGATVGSTPASGMNYYTEETIVMSGSGALVSGSPLAFTGTTIYGWATDPSGNTQRVSFGGGANPSQRFYVTGSAAGNWCVRYYQQNASSGQGITIKANMIPSVLKLVLETQLNSADVTTNKIGKVQIIAPTVTLSGAFTLSMKADGVANTPLTATALAYAGDTSGGCTSDPYYAKIIEYIDSTYWYSNVIGLAIEGGDYSLPKSVNSTFSVWAVPSTGAAFKADNSKLTFAKLGGVAECTISASTNGVIYSGSTSGSALFRVYITSASTIEATNTISVI